MPSHRWWRSEKKWRVFGSWWWWKLWQWMFCEMRNQWSNERNILKGKTSRSKNFLWHETQKKDINIYGGTLSFVSWRTCISAGYIKSCSTADTSWHFYDLSNRRRTEFSKSKVRFNWKKERLCLVCAHFLLFIDVRSTAPTSPFPSFLLKRAPKTYQKLFRAIKKPNG